MGACLTSTPRNQLLRKGITMDLPITAIVLEPDWADKAEAADFNVESIPSCFHYLCENSIGFTTTHPRYDESWFTRIRDQTDRYHGTPALRLLESAVHVTGQCDTSDDLGACVELLLRAAILASAEFRNVG
jgi:hypothetical protein